MPLVEEEEAYLAEVEAAELLGENDTEKLMDEIIEEATPPALLPKRRRQKRAPLGLTVPEPEEETKQNSEEQAESDSGAKPESEPESKPTATGPLDDFVEVVPGDDVRVRIISGSRLPGNKLMGENRLYFVRILAGEAGLSWASKLEEAKGKSYRSGRSALQKRKKNPTWNSDIWVQIYNLEKPELSVRLCQAIGDTGKVIKEEALGEMTIAISEKRYIDAKVYNLHGRNLDKNASILIDFERPEKTRLTSKIPPKGNGQAREVQVMVAPGARLCAKLGSGFGGIGARVNSLSVRQGELGPLELAGVRIGMYLISINGSEEVSFMNLNHVLKLVQKYTNSRYPTSYVFSTRPSKKAMQMGTINAMQNVLKRSSRKKLDTLLIAWIKDFRRRKVIENAELEAKAEFQRGNDLQIVIVSATDVYKEKKSYFVRIIVGEAGQSWREKQHAAASIGTVNNVRVVRTAETVRQNWANAINFSSSFWVRLDAIKSPEITIRLYSVSNGQTMIGEGNISNVSGTPSEPICTSNGIVWLSLFHPDYEHSRGRLSVSWARPGNVDATKENRRSIAGTMTLPDPMFYSVDVAPNTRLSAKFVPGFAGLGARISG
eukprot:g6433.t1